ncbi:MAG: fatty acid desaturase [Ilumatobacteraceae bacterium]
MLTTLLLGLVVGFAVTTLANVATTVFLHRALAHKALTMKPPIRFVFRVIVWMSTGIRPRQWAAVHRKHHAFTDVEGDPHSPVLLGWKTVQMKNVALYRAEAANARTLERYAKDIPQDAWDRALFDRALVGLGLGVVLLCVSFGWKVGLVASFAHVNMYLAGSAAVNAIGHHFGKRPYDDCTATNLQWLAFLTAGEGLHNNHHAAPTSARLSHRRGELDPGWWVISALKSLGLAKVRLNEVVYRSSARRPSDQAA